MVTDWPDSCGPGLSAPAGSSSMSPSASTTTSWRAVTGASLTGSTSTLTVAVSHLTGVPSSQASYVNASAPW
jgi:hypothetical protein